MYKYINKFAEFSVKYNAPDIIQDIPMTNEEIDAYISKYPVPYFPAALREMMQLIGCQSFESAFRMLTNPVDIRTWRGRIVKQLNNLSTFFLLDTYLDSYAAFIFLDGSDNPPVYAYFDDYGDKSCESFLWHNSIEDFLIYQHKRYYEAFLERLAGRTELQARVENAKAIFKPLREKARKLLTSAPELQEIQSVRLGLKWLQWAHKELFYNVYSPRYHADFSLWHKEMTKYNNLILKYLAKARPHIAAINPLYSQIVDELEIGFTNFAMRINEVAAAPDATVRQPSQAAKNAANEQRDITDFLI
jgi:hypothetical protein